MPYVAHLEESDRIVPRLVKDVATISGNSLEPWTAARAPARQIGIVLFEGFSLLRAGIVAEVFNKANQLAVAGSAVNRIYTVKMLSLAGGNVPCSSSVHLWTEPFKVRKYQNFDALFIGGGKGAQDAALEEALLGRMRFGYASGALRSTPIARSSYASPGLIGMTDRPGFNSQAEADTEEDCFSAMASALMLVKYDLGHDIAREVGEQVLPGAGAKLAMLLAEAGVTSVADKVRASARWLKDNCERSISVADAAQVAAM